MSKESPTMNALFHSLAIEGGKQIANLHVEADRADLTFAAGQDIPSDLPQYIVSSGKEIPITYRKHDMH